MGLVVGGLHWTVDSINASHPATLDSNPSIPKIFSEEILKELRKIDGTAYYRGQGHDKVNWTHLVLASSKLLLQKNMD